MKDMRDMGSPAIGSFIGSRLSSSMKISREIHREQTPTNSWVDWFRGMIQEMMLDRFDDMVRSGLDDPIPDPAK
jgi:hypothetical protein